MDGDVDSFTGSNHTISRLSRTNRIGSELNDLREESGELQPPVLETWSMSAQFKMLRKSMCLVGRIIVN